jgi:tetratricopeptide (TPR) repeat protein
VTRGLLVWAVVWTLPVVLVSATGCASRSTSSPFIIKNGSGPVDVGHGVGFKKIDRGQIERARREALARRAAAAPEQLRSIEGTDVALRNALAALGQLESAAAHVAVAQQYWRLHVYDAVYDHYTDAIRLEPRNVTALDGRARVWRQWHMTEPALSDAHRARYFGPERPDVLNTLGTILEQAGQCGAARDAYASALKLDPSAAWAKDNLVRLEGRTDTCGT